MKRREMILASVAACLAHGALAAPRTEQISRVLFLADTTLGPPGHMKVLHERIKEKLGEAGYKAGANLDLRMVPILAGGVSVADNIRSELEWKPHVIITHGTFVTRQTQKATSEIPIVFTQVADPLRAGIVREIARPGGNTTGVTQFFLQLVGKLLELIREILPSAKRVAVIWDRGHEYWPGFHQEFIDSAAALGLTVIEGDAARGEGTWEDCYRQVMPQRPEALMPIGPWPNLRRAIRPDEMMQAFQERTRIPVFYGGILRVSDPLLVQLGADFVDHVGRGADIVARVLSGEKPGDIAVDRATRIVLKVNLASARRLGITIPKAVLLRADEVMQ